jgi:hypothetical protein
MRKIDVLAPGTGNEAQVVEDGGVLYLIFKSTAEKRPCSKETCAEFGHPESKAQVDARDRHLDETLREYREARAKMTAEQKAEEAFEIRAAFGPGQKIVDIFTGEVTQT